jgi:hypothetical protein
MGGSSGNPRLQNPNPNDQGNSKLKSFFEREPGSFPYSLDSGRFGAQTPLQILRNARPQVMVEHLCPASVELRKDFARHGGQAEQGIQDLSE